MGAAHLTPMGVFKVVPPYSARKDCRVGFATGFVHESGWKPSWRRRFRLCVPGEVQSRRNRSREL